MIGRRSKSPNVINPETLRNIISELRRARRDHPSKAKNLEVLLYYVNRMGPLLSGHTRGQRGNEHVSAADIYANAIIIAVMAIRLAEEGASNYAYLSRGYEGETFATANSELDELVRRTEQSG